MDDEIDSVVLRVRADTNAFARDVGEIRRQLDGPLADGAEAAGSAIESALNRAVRTGKFGFDDLKRVALSALSDIAAQTVTAGFTQLGASGGGGIGALFNSIAGGLFGGAPGRATGGNVVGGQAYMVGERGPELFVPTAAGRIEPGGRAAPGRAINITVNVNAPADNGSGILQRSGQQVARQVAQALARADRR